MEQSTKAQSKLTVDFNKDTLKTLKHIESEVTARAAIYGQYDPVYEMELLHYVRTLRKTLKFMSEFVNDEVIDMATKKLNKSKFED